MANDVRDRIVAVGAKTAVIEPGSPRENGCCESFNARLRDERLDGEIFQSLREARIVIEGRRGHHNTRRPHKRPRLKASGTGGLHPGSAEAGHAPTIKLDQADVAAHNILAALEEASKPMSPRELAVVAGMKNGNVRRLLHSVLKAGEVQKSGPGRYTLPSQ